MRLTRRRLLLGAFAVAAIAGLFAIAAHLNRGRVKATLLFANLRHGEVTEKVTDILNEGTAPAWVSRRLESGWRTRLPDGSAIWKSRLEEYADQLVAEGLDAADVALRYVRDENAALRYVAIRTLEELLGIRCESGRLASHKDNPRLERFVADCEARLAELRQ